jgi:hypothetical protein
MYHERNPAPYDVLMPPGMLRRLKPWLIFAALVIAGSLMIVRAFADDWRGNERDMDTVRERARPVYDAARESAQISGPAYRTSRPASASGADGWASRCARDRYGRPAGC